MEGRRRRCASSWPPRWEPWRVLGLWLALVLALPASLAAVQYAGISPDLSRGPAWWPLPPYLLLPVLLAAFILQGGLEELIIRGYIYHTLRDRWRPWISALGSSTLFALLHLGNPDVSASALLNIVLAGMVLAALVERTGSLWSATLAHGAWNFAVACLLSVPVSGVRIFHLLNVTITGEPGLTGDGFGPEGSWLLTAIGVVLTAFLWRGLWRRPSDRGAAAARPSAPEDGIPAPVLLNRPSGRTVRARSPQETPDGVSFAAGDFQLLEHFSPGGMTIMKLLALSSLLLIAAGSPALAATPPPPAAPSFGEAVEVNVVNVDVYATDKSGHRVTGLGKDDFELRRTASRWRSPTSRSSAAARRSALSGGRPPARLRLRRRPRRSRRRRHEPGGLLRRPDLYSAHRDRVLKQLREFLAHQLGAGRPGDAGHATTWACTSACRSPAIRPPSPAA